MLAFPLRFLAARNVVANRIVHFLSRRSLDTIRGVDTLIWALIWINVVGLGPFAGILAIVMSRFRHVRQAVLGGDRDRRQAAGRRRARRRRRSRCTAFASASCRRSCRCIASQVLYYFESNTRSATIIGIVGAGGIGLQLSEQIRMLEWQNVSFLILLILVTVAIIDWVSSRLRFAIIGRAAHH